MQLSTNWLKDYLKFDLSRDELSEILTLIGLEVEGEEEVEEIKGGLTGVKIGKILTCEKHPNADKLNVTTVDLGGEPVQIVCGAPNVKVGQKVPVATVGTLLYDDKGESFKIKKGKIRGEVSEGMICAEDELGLGDSHEGIMVLNEDAEIGSNASDYFNISSDFVYEIGLTPNRSDATCHMGCAEDLCAYLKVNKGFTGDVKRPSVSDFDVKRTIKPIKVSVENVEACPRYTGVVIDNVQIGPSPEWMQKRLNAIGVRPISNIVDITNFILHELGQPLHAFDYDKIAKQHVIVKNLAQGTTFLSLDEKERSLDAADLIICDGNEKPMCIGGVFGGLDSGVTDATTTIFLESAHFNAGSIRKSSTRHGLRTDAAKVFEKGSDPNITEYALKRAALLIQEYAGGEIASEVVDIYPNPIGPREIHIKYEKINNLIGADISQDEVHTILRAMNMEISPVDEKSIKVKVPTNKADVVRDVDLIEEILRIYGFNKIEIPSKVSSTLSFRNKPDKNKIKNTIADHLSSIGFHEMMGLSLIESKFYDEVLPIGEEQRVYINNTSNIHLDIMRPEMMLSGLLSVLRNHNRQQLRVRLFEMGRAYLQIEDGFQEDEYITIFMSGPAEKESWKSTNKKDVDFYDIKQTVASLFQRLGINGYQVDEVEDARFNYGLKYFRGKQTLARFGQVSSDIANKIALKTDVFYAEMPIVSLMAALKNKKDTTLPISKYPSMRRDLALVVDKSVTYSEMEAIAKKTGKKLLKEVNLFDVYENKEQLGEGKKSYAVSFKFEDVEKTLKDKEVEKIMKQMIQNYESKLGALIRS